MIDPLNKLLNPLMKALLLSGLLLCWWGLLGCDQTAWAAELQSLDRMHRTSFIQPLDPMLSDSVLLSQDLLNQDLLNQNLLSQNLLSQNLLSQDLLSQTPDRPQSGSSSVDVSVDGPVDRSNLENNPTLEIDNISTEKIGQFIQAYLQVLSLIEQRETELHSVELESESQQIEREIEAQAIELICSTGLTLQEYLQILSLTNLDPEFGERVAAQLQEAAN